MLLPHDSRIQPSHREAWLWSMSASRRRNRFIPTRKARGASSAYAKEPSPSVGAIPSASTRTSASPPAAIPNDRASRGCSQILPLKWNMQQNHGTVRYGLALLAGILRCGHCGRLLRVAYKRESALYSQGNRI